MTNYIKSISVQNTSLQSIPILALSPILRQLLTYAFISLIIADTHPFTDLFSFRNRQQIYWGKPGEYGGMTRLQCYFWQKKTTTSNNLSKPKRVLAKFPGLSSNCFTQSADQFKIRFFWQEFTL